MKLLQWNKKIVVPTGFVLAACLLIQFATAQLHEVVVDDPDKDSLNKYKTLIEKYPDSLPFHQAFIKVLGKDSKLLPDYYTQWSNSFPKSENVPLAYATSLYNAESPKAKPWLLKVIERNPKNAKAYQMLNIDAERWGDGESASMYLKKATEAAPDDPSYAFYYAMDFEHTDPAEWRKKLWELARRFPDSERGAQGLYWLAYRSTNKKEKLEVFEKLRVLYNPAKFSWSNSGMSGLYDLYITENVTDKAVQLAQQMGEKGGWPDKVTSAKKIIEVQQLLKAKNYAKAGELAGTIKTQRYSEASTFINLLKANCYDKAGNTQAAYDSLVILQASNPDDGIQKALNTYGTKLNKTAEQVNADVWTLRNKKSTKAPDFELAMYTENRNAKLTDYKGKVVLLTFWFPGCGPCRGEFPHFQEIVNKFSNDKLAYIGINVYPEQDDYVIPFMNGTKYTFTPLKSTAQWAQEVYKVRGQPTNFLIDQDGNIVYANFMINANNTRLLELMIESLLKKRS